MYGNDENKWKRIRGNFLEWVLEKSGYAEVNDIPKLTEVGQILMTGLLIMSDWISSNDTYFPLLSVSEEGDEGYYPQRIEKAIGKLNLLKPWKSTTSCMGESVFKEYFGFCQDRYKKILFRQFES